MESDESELLTLKSLLNEFFTQPISNERRREVESTLVSWQQRELSWKQSIHLLSKSNDQYVAMFCLTVFETVINKKWMGLGWQDKRAIKEFLYQLSTQQNITPFALTKTVKLVVDTARHDWPHFYPDFFSNVICLLRSDGSVHLGLVYLHTISQELGHPRVDLSVARNSELQRLLLLEMPEVFLILSDLLSSRHADECYILKALNHLFTWVPADQIPQSLVTDIFRIALNFESLDKALLALGTLNEMLYRHWTPPCWQQFLQFIYSFLQAPSHNLDKSYMERMCDLLRLVLSSHMSRGAENMNELLLATLQWTEQQQTLSPGLTSCMTVWSSILDHPRANRYGEKLVLLAELVIRRAQWTYGNTLLVDETDGELDEEKVDEKPWRRALRPCLEVVVKVAELLPDQTLRAAISEWMRLCQSAPGLSSADSHLELVLRDLSTLTRAVGCLSPVWGERDSGELVKVVFHHLLVLARLHYHSIPETTELELITMHCETLAVLKTCCCWLTRLPETELRQCLQQVLETITVLLSEGTHRKLQHSAAHLLSSLTSTTRLPDTWESPTLRPLFDHPLSHLDKEDGYLVAGALLNCLILPAAKPDGNDPRLQLALCFIERLTLPLSQQDSNFIGTLNLLVYLVRLYESEGSRQKKILCTILQTSAERALVLYRTYQHDSDLSREILLFFKTLLECLQTQVGVAFVQGVVESFLVSFSSERLQTALQTENGGGLQELLGILELVVRTPALAAAGLTPLTVELSLQLAQPLLLETSSPAVQEAYFQLVFSIVEHKWQYLVKGCVDSGERVEEFLGLLRAMGRALLLSDINLFRLNLTHFEKLNQRWKLYRTTLFKKELLGELLVVLLMTLLNKSHALLADDIVICLCHLISTDPDAFFSHYLPNFLNSIGTVDSMQRDNLLRNFPKDMDFPSLTKNILRLVNDLSCYQTCNFAQSSIGQPLHTH